MLYQPTNKIHIIPESTYSEDISQIEKTLALYVNSGELASFDGCKLHYEYYLAEHAHASIILVHGLSEFLQKYYEFTWYCLNMGYNVFLYDQRGHGLSERKIEGLSLIHVDKFDDYVDDLQTMIMHLVKATAPTLPVYIYSHSMGGAVSSLYLAKYPDTVTRAVLSSPMICPTTKGVPLPIAGLSTHFYAKRTGWEAKYPHSNEFNPEVQVSASADISYARFRRNLDIRIRNPIYRTSATTNRWMNEALQMQKRLLSAKVTHSIKCPVLLLSAGQDTTVKLRPQKQFAKRLSNCRLYSFPTSKHSIYNGTEDILQEYYNIIFNFYGS